MQVRGVNGQVTLLSDRLQIKRAGAMARLTQARNGDKDVLLSDLSGVRIHLPSLLSNGYIRFFLINGESADATLIRAASDANTVLFSSRQLTRFTLLKNEIEKKIAALQLPVLLLPAPAIISEPAVEAMAEPPTEPASDAATESVSEHTSEESASIVEPVPEAAPEPVSAPEITPEVLASTIPTIAPTVSPAAPAGLPPIDFEQLDLLAEQFKQGLISRSEWVAAKKKLLRL
ncbi:DUF4429 domain-containing protein [Collimonas arenae]|nr:DUF4429 domain-containing protein [Collimonas arenae]